MPSDSERTALYRLYDAQDRLLYIGIAVNPERRWKQHARDRAETWWPDVARKEVEWFPSREQAAKAEERAIKGEGPPYNSKLTCAIDDPSRGWKRVARPPSARARQIESEIFERGARFHLQSRHRKMTIPALVAEKLRSDIRDGKYPLGERLPTNHELLAHFGISHLSLSRGIAELKAEGLLEIRPGRGTYVIALPA